MNRLTVLLLIGAIFVFVETAYGQDEEGTFNITQGICNQALAIDMVYTEYVHKYGVPLMERNATSSWYGDKKIYCLKALNKNSKSTGGTAFVKKGGIGHYFVTIEMHSKRGNSLKYDVQIYAR